jgi:hypothetical protein
VLGRELKKGAAVVAEVHGDGVVVIEKLPPP